MSIKRIVSTILGASIFIITGWLLPHVTDAAEHFHLSKRLLQCTWLQFGNDGIERLEQWQDIIRIGSSLSEFERLEKVNRYINRMSFFSDITHWHKEDYWATPYEFIASGGGDCEDYAIAKYYTLRAMGVDRKHLRIAYVNVKVKGTPHMVLLYFQNAADSPFVLDNLENVIQQYNKRSDLELVYSANEDNVWGITEDGHFQPLGNSAILHKLSELITRTHQFNLP